MENLEVVMKNIKGILLSALIVFNMPISGMWLLKKGKIVSTAMALSAGLIYGFSDELRLAALKNPNLEGLRNKYPELLKKAVTNPLLKRIRYNDLNEFINESASATSKRQKIAQELADANIPLNLSQTEADILTFHTPKMKKTFINNAAKIIKTYNDSIFKFWDFPVKKDAAILNDVFKDEKKENNEGNMVLHHAISPSAYAANYIGTQLQSISKNNSEAQSSYLLLRQLPNQNRSWLDQIKDWFCGTNENKIREKFLQRKSFDSYDLVPHNDDDFNTRRDNYPDISRYLMSCTYSIPNGAENTDEAFLDYLLMAGGNSSISFEKYGIPEEILNKYISRLEQAKKSFRATPFSRIILQISLSPELLNKTVYPSLPYGYKLNVYNKETGQKISELSEVFKIAKNKPFNISIHEGIALDQLQFRLIVDKNLLLNSDNPEVKKHFKVKAFAGDPESLTKFHQEIDQIVQEIKAEVSKKKSLKKI